MLQGAVGLDFVGGLQHRGGTASQELGAVRPLLLGKLVEALDELVVQLHENLPAPHRHMVVHMSARLSSMPARRCSSSNASCSSSSLSFGKITCHAARRAARCQSNSPA